MTSIGNVHALRALSNDDIRANAPSVFATEAHASRSARYAFIPTTAVLERMREAGFIPVSAQQARSRHQGSVTHNKHMLKFVNRIPSNAKVGDTVAQVALVNSHNGSSAYDLLGGAFRLACLNGLLVGGDQIASIKVPHTGNVVDRVIEGSFTVIENAVKAIEVAADWRGISLSSGMQMAFAHDAAKLRWEDRMPINANELLVIRREEDRPTDLWTTFNRVQEALVRGGQEGRTASGRKQMVRAIKGIDGNVALNRSLWSLAEGYAKLHRPN